ncbi:MAG: septum formation inhibitor [Capnocytophaga sp.]|nr:septum formation inhibitor [Capnocytophaga sp.]
MIVSKVNIKKILKTNNLYWVISAFFIVWMLFFDTNSMLTHRELNKEMKKLNKQKQFLQKEIQKDRNNLNELNTLEGKERFGRETYYLKRDNEELFIIEYDTIN